MKEYIGKLQGDNLRIAIVVARFNELITKKLLEGAIEGLTRLGTSENDIAVAWVPGSFEIPVVVKKMASSGNFDAVICLGAIIRGSTSHFDYVAGQASSGIGQISLETGIPTIFGVLTTDTIEQAIERAGTKMGNKGFECAQAAIEMANLLKELDRIPSSTVSKYSTNLV